jgi:hypothetical protein
MFGKCKWIMPLMSGLAEWIAECSINPATFTPKFVVLKKMEKET